MEDAKSWFPNFCLIAATKQYYYNSFWHRSTLYKNSKMEIKMERTQRNPFYSSCTSSSSIINTIHIRCNEKTKKPNPGVEEAFPISFPFVCSWFSPTYIHGLYQHQRLGGRENQQPKGKWPMPISCSTYIFSLLLIICQHSTVNNL